MNSKLYVGNVSYDVKEDDLKNLFQDYGTVQSAKIIIDRMSGKSKGFGFVDMETAEAAQAAIDALNGKDFFGRALRVNIARDKEEGGGGRGGFRSGGGGFQRRGGGNRDRSRGPRGGGNYGGHEDGGNEGDF